MNGPRSILMRAEAARKPQSSAMPVAAQPSVVPVPMQSSALEPPIRSDTAMPENVQRVVVPQPIRKNSIYHQLMQRHDRMTTQHLKG